MRIALELMCCACLMLMACEAPVPTPVDSGPYLGQTPPGMSPGVFAPGIVSTHADELNAAFSADGREMYFSRGAPGGSKLMVTREVGGVWTDVTVASVSGTQSDVDPFLTSDGTTLFFSSRRPLDDSGTAKDADLWFAERREGGNWGDPQRVAGVNVAEQNDYYTSIDAEGTLYFSRFDSNGVGDLYRAGPADEGYGDPERVPAPVHSNLSEHDPFIAPDGSFLIFSSNRPGGYGENDLYISFRADDGSWLEPRNMGSEVNSEGYDYCPMVSHDGQYFFFTREIDGDGDIYWVDASVLGAR